MACAYVWGSLYVCVCLSVCAEAQSLGGRSFWAVASSTLHTEVTPLQHGASSAESLRTAWREKSSQSVTTTVANADLKNTAQHTW